MEKTIVNHTTVLDVLILAVALVVVAHIVKVIASIQPTNENFQQRKKNVNQIEFGIMAYLTRQSTGSTLCIPFCVVAVEPNCNFETVFEETKKEVEAEFPGWRVGVLSRVDIREYLEHVKSL